MRHEWEATLCGEQVRYAVEHEGNSAARYFKRAAGLDQWFRTPGTEIADLEILRLAEREQALAARVSELEQAPDGLVAYNCMTAGHRRLREVLKAAGLWRPQEGDGRGGAIGCAIEAIERIGALEQQLAVERKHREAAERQRDDKAEEIRRLRAEREELLAGRLPEVASRIQALEQENQRLRLELARRERAENPLAKPPGLLSWP